VQRLARRLHPLIPGDILLDNMIQPELLTRLAERYETLRRDEGVARAVVNRRRVGLLIDIRLDPFGAGAPNAISAARSPGRGPKAMRLRAIISGAGASGVAAVNRSSERCGVRMAGVPAGSCAWTTAGRSAMTAAPVAASAAP
jgi:hypothetical protein